MGMDDRENVALIGGGHTFGKCHGAGPEGAGPSPQECPFNPYPGLHGSGKGDDAVTSGFEGPWTTKQVHYRRALSVILQLLLYCLISYICTFRTFGCRPVQWDNEYFKNLLNYEWEVHTGPGGNWQWRVKDGKGPKAPTAHGSGQQDIMMLTTDIALITDPEYRKYAEEFAKDEKAFAQAFAEVWYKLVNRDMGPVTRMVGPDVAPPQDWQFPLPDPPAKLADMGAVEETLTKMLNADSSKTSDLVRLAMNSASTFRHTDYLGGCNGARIRFHLGWKSNEGLDKVCAFLEPVKAEFGDGLSWADLIVLAGNVAVKSLGAPKDLPFNAGRTDAADGAGWNPLELMNAAPPTTIEEVADRNALRGLSSKEFVALAFPNYPKVASLKALVEEADSSDEDLLAMSLKYSPYFKRWVEYYVHYGDNEYVNDFASTWTKMMNADRFAGPVENLALVDA
jgi:catalase-peroxidase